MFAIFVFERVAIVLFSHHIFYISISCAGAHHSLWLFDPTTDQPIAIEGSRTGIGGVVAKHRGFETRQMPLFEQATMFYLFSDGYTDQLGGKAGRKYLTRNFRDDLQAMHNLPAEEQYTKLEENLKNWQQDVPQSDDILVVGFRY